MQNNNQIKTQLERLVLGFIADYEAWNNFAAQYVGSRDKAIEDEIYAKYKYIIDTYCLPNKQFQGLAYGGESSHQVAKESIESIDIDPAQNKATVETKMMDKFGGFDFYTYQFVCENETWYLDEIFYCGYPCL